MNLHQISKTSTTITLGWDPVPNAVGFEYIVDGKRSNTWDGSTTQAKFSANAKSIEVIALSETDSGLWPLPTPPPTPTPTGANKQVGLFALGGSLGNMSHLNDGTYDVVIADAAYADLLANGCSGAGFAYFTLTQQSSGFFTGVTPSEMDANGWWATRSGNKIPSFANCFLADITNTAYLNKFAENVIAAVPSNLHGIYLDDVIATPIVLTNGAYPDNLSSNSAWQAAMVRAIGTVHAKLQAVGFKLALNAGAYIPNSPTWDDGLDAQNWFKRLAPNADVLCCEYWPQAADNSLRTSGASWNQQFDNWQALVSVTKSLGVAFVGNMHATSGQQSAMVYGRAAMLLDDSNPGSAFCVTPDDSNDPYGAWAQPITLTAASKTQTANGWSRSPVTINTSNATASL